MVRKAFRPSGEENEREGWVGRDLVCSTDFKNVTPGAKVFHQRVRTFCMCRSALVYPAALISFKKPVRSVASVLT